MPTGLCPPRRWERAVPVASPTLGALASPCQDIPLAESRSRLLPPHSAAPVWPQGCCQPASCCPWPGRATCFLPQPPARAPGVQPSDPLTAARGTAVRGGITFPGAKIPAECCDSLVALSSLSPCQVELLF